MTSSRMPMPIPMTTPLSRRSRLGTGPSHERRAAGRCERRTPVPRRGGSTPFRPGWNDPYASHHARGPDRRRTPRRPRRRVVGGGGLLHPRPRARRRGPVGHADRPARVGRARRRRPHRAPRVAARRAPSRGGRHRRRAARDRDDGPLHRAGRRGPSRRVPGRAHHRDPRVHHGPPHPAPRRPARRRIGPGARPLRRDRVDAPGCSCATVRSTCGCTSRTCAVRSTCPATSTRRRHCTPPPT